MVGQIFTIVKIRNVLMVTVPADLDDLTVTSMQEQLLQAMQRYEALGLVLDISAVDTLDSFFARTLAETAQMVMLLGGQTVIVGMRPSVAITMTELGLKLGNTLTALNVDRALDILTNLPAGE